MSDYDKECPRCGKKLMSKDGSGAVHLLTRLTTFKDGKALGKCPQCKQPVELPIRLAPTVRHVVTRT